MAKIRISRYRREGFVKDVKPGRGIVMRRIKPAMVKAHLRKDMGAKGRTPKAKQWYQPGGNLHGYKISQPMTERRRKAAIGRTDISSGRALQQLSNLSSDRETQKIAKQDAEYFFKKHKWEKR